MQTREPLCKHCAHASFSEPGKAGSCSRFPPSAIVIYNDDGGHDIRYAFPPVMEVTTACGEFRPLMKNVVTHGKVD